MAQVLWAQGGRRHDPLESAISWMESRALRVMDPRLRIDAIIVGGCGEALGTDRIGAMRRSAHAHTARTDQQRGWICLKGTNERRLLTPSGRPTVLLWHEFAHVWTASGHTDRWRALLIGVGQRAEAARYPRKERHGTRRS